MSPLLALACVLLLWLAACGLLTLGWVLLVTLRDFRARLRHGYEARSWSASASANRVTVAPRAISTECATVGRSQADTVTHETPRAPNRTTAHGSSTTGPRVATEAGRLRGVPMTAVEAAQLVAHGDLAPMPPWREVGIEAGRQLDEAMTEALNLGDAA